MKVLFCLHNLSVAAEYKQVHRPTISLPLGVLSIAANIRSKSWPGNIEIYDARLSGKITNLPNGDIIFGDLDAEIERRIRDSNPDVIAISNMFSWQISNAFQMAKIAKKACPNSIVVIGGPHASSFPEETLKEPGIDYVIMGEGEERFYKFLLAIENKEEVAIQGVIGKIEDTKLLKPNKKVPIDFIQNLDALPLPAYDMVDVDRYMMLQSKGFSPRPYEWGKRAFSLLTSRGCPHQCVFCSIQATMGYKWRHHSPEYIQKHIDLIVEKYGCDFIHFEDDNFTHDPERYDEIIDSLIKRRKIIKWDTPNGIRGDTWTYERIKKTKASGCQQLTVAVESAVQEVIDKVVKKRLDLKQVSNLMEYCRKVNLRLNAFFVIGLPGETKKDILKTYDFAIKSYKEYNVTPCVNLAKALPGTELYDNAIKNHLYTGKLEFKPNEITTDEFDPIWIAKENNKFQRNILKLKILNFLFSPNFWMIRVVIEKTRIMLALRFNSFIIKPSKKDLVFK